MTYNYLKLLPTLLLFFAFNKSIQAQCEDRFLVPIFEEVTETEDVQYGSAVELSGDSKLLKFDFFEPTGDTYSERPLIILAHGGTFIVGDENDIGIQIMCEYYAKLGYACASINYRLADISLVGPEFDFDITAFMADELIKATHDMKAAIRYFRKDYAENENQFNIDPDQIFIGGISAGALAAINVAYMDDEEGIDSIVDVDVISLIESNGGFEGDSGNENYSSEVKAVISMSGAVAHRDIIQADEAPIISIHETGDGTVPYGTDVVSVSGIAVIEVDGSSVLHEHAIELEMYNTLITFDQEGHVSYFGNEAQLASALNSSRDFIYELVECVDGAETVDVTFNVNMQNEVVSEEGVYVAGGEWFGQPGDNELTDPDGDGVYTGTLSLAADGQSFYTFTNGACPDFSCKENIAGLPCANPDDFNDRLLVTGTENITISTCFSQCSEDGTCEEPAQPVNLSLRVNTSDVDVDAAGMFLGANFDNWTGDLAMTEIQPDVWEYVASLPPGTYEYKFLNGNWDGQEVFTAEDHGECTLTTGEFTNRVIELGDVDLATIAYCFNACVECETSGIDDLASSLSVYPTIVERTIQVQLDSSTESQVRFLDVNGHILSVQDFNGSTQIDVTNYPSGVYFVNVVSDGYSFAQKVMVK